MLQLVITPSVQLVVGKRLKLELLLQVSALNITYRIDRSNMAEYNDREAFIPYSRSDIVRVCLEDGQLNESQQKFEQFCQILIAYIHFKFHYQLQQLKTNYTPFAPDLDIRYLDDPSDAQLEQQENELVKNFQQTLKQANYIPLSSSTLEKTFAKRSLIDLKTEVDFNDFEQMVCYRRGEFKRKTTVKKFFLFKQEKELPRLLLVIGVFLFVVFGPEALEALRLSVREEEVRDVMPILISILSLGITFASKFGWSKS